MERVFYPSGSLRREINWKNGLRHGTERIYGAEGEQLARIRWTRGKEAR
jgi:antitoxin component YwqK of YwqJK toxin-antitoxin module